MAMRPRGGAVVPRPQYIVRPTYEDFEPTFDEKEEPTSYVLHIYLPGFTREQLKVTYLESAKKIKAHGERPLGNYRWSRFEKEFSIPNDCIGSQIRGKFERNVLTITMQKKAKVQESASPVEPKKTEEAIPPKPQKVTSPEKASADTKPQKGKQDSPQKLTSAGDLGEKVGDKSPPKVSAESKPQKGKQDSSQKLTSAADHGEKVRDKSPPKVTSPEKASAELNPQKGKQDLSQKLTSAGDLGKKVRDMSPPKATSPAESKPQKGKQDSPQKPTTDADKKIVEPMSPPQVTSQTKPQKVQDQSPTEQEHESVTQKAMEKSDGGDKEKPEMSRAKRSSQVKDVAAYGKEVMGKLAKRLKEDVDSKQSLMNAGVAAMVIVAMGTYIGYTIGSGDFNN